MQKSVAHLFGSEAKVKIMRLFIFNPGLTLNPKEVSKRAKTSPTLTKKELLSLIKAGLIKRSGNGHTLNRTYRYLSPISNFLIDANPLTEKEIAKRIASTGTIKLILISGIFLHNSDSRVDILVVGDHIKQNKLLSVMSSIEAELGKELRYAVFETPDFQYRLGIYDKLIRDIFDSEHQKIIDKLGIEDPSIPVEGYPQA
ncbi:MAG TPA: hypothetical protein VJJ48_01215 [Candidatus Paceibacterota bacterium]